MNNYPNSGIGDKTNGGMKKVTKKIKKHFLGVPTTLDQIMGRIENISCGEKNSYAIVKI